MNYKKLAYEALQRVSVSTMWSEDTIQRVADCLEATLKNTTHSKDYAKCSKCGSDRVEQNYYCRDCDNEVHIENFA